MSHYSMSSFLDVLSGLLNNPFTNNSSDVVFEASSLPYPTSTFSYFQFSVSWPYLLFDYYYYFLSKIAFFFCDSTSRWKSQGIAQPLCTCLFFITPLRLIPQMLWQKFFIMTRPWGVRSTSGWNCRPYIGRVACWTPAIYGSVYRIGFEWKCKKPLVENHLAV